MEKYTVDYFIGKFEAIPEDQWAVDTFNRGGRKCVNGHCGARYAHIVQEQTGEVAGLQRVMFPLCKDVKMIMDIKEYEIATRYSITAARINNGTDDRYQQATPKQRILAALADIKQMGQEKKQQALEEVSLLLQGIDFSEEKKEPVYAG